MAYALLSVLTKIVIALVIAAPTVALLKHQYVLFGIGLVVLALGAGLQAESDTPRAIALVGVVLWIVGAFRPGWPHSVWARMRYDETRMARARERLRGPSAGAPPTRPTVPPRPPALDRAGWVLLAGFVLGTLVASVLSLVAGVLIPVLLMVRDGWSKGRTVITVVTGVGVLSWIITVVSAADRFFGPDWPFLVLVCVPVALVVTGTVLLYRPAVSDYLRSAYE